MDRRPNGTFAMDRFTTTPFDGLASISVFPPSVDPNLQFLGRHYALAQANFQPEVAPTLPNVLAALAGTSDGWYSNDNRRHRTGSIRFSTNYRPPAAPGPSFTEYHRPCSKGRSGTG